MNDIKFERLINRFPEQTEITISVRGKSGDVVELDTRPEIVSLMNDEGDVMLETVKGMVKAFNTKDVLFIEKI